MLSLFNYSQKPNQIIVALFAFSAYVLGTNPVYATNTYQPKIGTYGGKINVGTIALPSSLNPYQKHSRLSEDIVSHLYRGLTELDPISVKVIPSLAESWSISDNKTIYTFKLRPNLKWSDGKPLTADDVVFTYNKIINNPLIPNDYRDGLMVDYKGAEYFPKVKKVDARTIQFKTIIPLVIFPHQLAAPIMPKHIFDGTIYPAEKESKKIKYNEMWKTTGNLSKIIVNGPFKPDIYIPEQQLVFTSNSQYYLKDAQGNQLPYLKSLVFNVLEPVINIYKENRKNTFRPGISDILAVPTKDALAIAMEDTEHLSKEAEKTNFTLQNLGASSTKVFVMLNQTTAQDKSGQPFLNSVKTKWFRDQHFRQALAYAVNKKRMINEIDNGYSVSVGAQVSTQNPFYEPNIKRYPYDLKKATNILQTAGYKKDAKGQLHDAEGNPVRFRLTTNSGNFKRDAICRILVEDWGKLGIEVTYYATQFEQLINQLDTTLDWEAMVMGISGSSIDPHTGFYAWNLDNQKSMHMFNMGAKAPKPTRYTPWEIQVSDLYQQAASEFNEKKRRYLYSEAQKIVAAQVPFLFTINETSLVAYHNRIGNMHPTIHGSTEISQLLWNIEYLYEKYPINGNQNPRLSQ